MGRAICGSPALALLDARLESSYGQTLKAFSGSPSLMAEQHDWIQRREVRCGTYAGEALRACIVATTNERIAELEKIAARGPLQPPNSSDNIVAEPLSPITPPSQLATDASKPEVARPSTVAIDDAAASLAVIESIQGLLTKEGNERIRFVKYNVDKNELSGFKGDMPLLRIVYDERVFFDTDKSVLRAEALPVIKSIAATLRGQREKVALFVAGHTDARGKEQYNLDLSIRRAESVARAIKLQGPGGAYIWRVGFGKAIPIRPNNSDQNMALNRRVEFLIASQPNVIAAWIKTTKGLCEDEACGLPSLVTGYQAVPITDNATNKPIEIQIPLPKAVEIEMNPKPIEVGPPLR